ncbi:MAG: pilus assembly protein TadG-related protein [Acidobacteriota bacterium]|nr:pilus assembly protein TadG-related protein [Acidobacteriota bacterium]
MSIFLIGALGLAIDGGQMYAQLQMAQAAADAAAQAGMMSIFRGTNATSAFPFGTGLVPIASSVCTAADGRTPCVFARYNGFGTASDRVTLSFPTTVSGVTLSSATVPAFTVAVQRTLQTGLIRFVGAPATSSISAKATAALVKGVSPFCVYALDPSAQNAFQVTNGATVNLGGCAVAINSTDSDAATISGNSTLTATAVDVVGGAVINGGSTVTPSPVTGGPPVADPFVSVPAPAIGGCNFVNFSKGSGSWPLIPGVYCGGLSLHNGAIATFQQGVYIIKDGPLSFAFSTSTNTGSGVTFYLTGTNATYGSVTVSNGASVTLSASSSGPYMGLLFYQDRSITSAVNATFNGGSSMQLTGSLYFPTTSVSFSNGSAAVAYSTAIVAKRVSFGGGTSSNIKYDPTGLQTGLFLNSVALVQ